MSDRLYEKSNYLIDARFIKSVMITEYDIRAANISVLRDRDKIDDNMYNYLLSIPKIDREVYIGKAYDKYGEDIKEGIRNAKKRFFDMNHILDSEVIRIANDAIYVMRNSPVKMTKIGKFIEFVPKHTYTLFARLSGITILFSSNLGDPEMDVIGLGREQIPLHEDYMLNFIGNLFYNIENEPLSSVVEYFNDFYTRYLERDLDPGFYRELNPQSCFVYGSARYAIMDCPDINQVDISYNAGILRELYGIVTELL